MFTAVKQPTFPDLNRGYFVQPTVFADVEADMRVFQKEVLCPFTVVTCFDTEPQALELANDPPLGLATAVRTQDVSRARSHGSCEASNYLLPTEAD